MSRYIDADKIKEVIRNDVPLKYFMTSSYDVAIINALKVAEILNDKIPTADVKEVKHGEWIEDKKDSSSQCSVCGWYTDYDYDYVTNNGLGNEDFLFCGHCGARMDGGVKE